MWFLLPDHNVLIISSQPYSEDTADPAPSKPASCLSCAEPAVFPALPLYSLLGPALYPEDTMDPAPSRPAVIPALPSYPLVGSGLLVDPDAPMESFMKLAEENGELFSMTLGAGGKRGIATSQRIVNGEFSLPT